MNTNKKFENHFGAHAYLHVFKMIFYRMNSIPKKQIYLKEQRSILTSNFLRWLCPTISIGAPSADEYFFLIENEMRISIY